MGRSNRQKKPTPPGFEHKVVSTSPWARARANFVVADDPEPYFRAPRTEAYFQCSGGRPHGAAELQGIRSDHQVDQPDQQTRPRSRLFRVAAR